MSYVIRRTDQGGGYVSRPGAPSSYTHALQHARVFATRGEAERERCPENEKILTLEQAVGGAL